MSITWNEALALIPAGFVAIIFIIFLIDYSASRLNQDPIPTQKPKSPDVQFLEDALADDPQPNPNYTYDDFQRDLRDKRLTFNEIYEKCGGQIPQKPKESESVVESEIASEDDERRKKMQALFEKMGKGSPILKVVNPPPQPQPIVAITGQPVPCSVCKGSGRYTMLGHYPWIRDSRPDGKCASCNGTGFVIISRG